MGLYKSDSNKYAFRLYSKSTNFDRMIIISGHNSTLYSLAINGDFSRDAIETELNIKDKTTSVVIGKIHLFLDFNTEKYEQYYVSFNKRFL